MYTLTMCRNMESMCRRRARIESPRREKWIDERDAWNNRAHKEIARRFRGESDEADDQYMQ